jgi:glycosyltransferase involved in cell wall biosynthesis/2-polyprenyl-3-methyl-5-hydroxy-6-metoxy-1,4-benzoquinol methylase
MMTTAPKLAPDKEPPIDVEPVRVLHVYSGNLFGGIETFLSTLARHRSDAQATADFALCFEGRLADELRASGAALHVLGAVRARSPRSIAAARRALAEVLQRRRYHVVVCHSAWPHALFAPVARRCGARLVYFMHDVPNARGWVDRWADRTPPDLVLCNSEFTAASGRWFFPGVTRTVARLPVELARTTDQTRRAQTRSALDTASDAIVILQASRMQEWKGHRLLIDALGELRGHARWVCWIAGGAQRASEIAYQRELEERVERLGLGARVRFLGQRSDVPALMEAADIFCQPNLGPEPFGMAFVEALGAGLPVVATAMGGASEIVTPSCGRLVAADAKSVAAALRELLDDGDERQRLAAAGPERAQALCEPRERTMALARELGGVAQGGRAPDVHARALYSGGQSGDVILSTVRDALRARGGRFDVLVDLGCGRGACARHLAGLYDQYVGCDVVAYDAFPHSRTVSFREVDLNRAPYPIESASASAVVSVETIEHVENPRLLVREMARVVRSGGLVVVTTPNQLSLFSKLHLVVKNEFLAFKEAPGLYPAHITALVEKDLERIAHECGLVDIQFRYTGQGRIPFTAASWPRRLGARGRWFSDNVVMVASRP